MASPRRVVLIACGSYNPVTNMHLRMFELARDSMNRTGRFKVIGGVISPVGDQYEKKDLQPAKHRCNMLREALTSSDWIRMDTWECEQPSWSRTALVLRHHQAILDGASTNNTNNPAPSKRRRREVNRDYINQDDDNANHNLRNKSDNSVNLRLLCGADLLESFGTPGLWSEEDIEYIVGKHGLVCITREGSDPRKFIYESDVLTKYEDNIHILTEWIHNDISSTKIRRSLRRGDSVKYLLQDCVIDYVNKHGLYGTTVDNKVLNGIIKTPTNEKEVDETKQNLRFEGKDEVDGSPRQSPRPQPIQTRNIVVEEERPRSPKRVHPNSWVGPPSPKSPRHVSCMRPDISGLVRRVRNVRIVGFAPETCV
ncbi:nicotinamide/nicotinic acid mononucleotide adenylyltransferase 1-like isoform X1 [Mytilus edulis]|uniref:nicotinamide/nicotinic acid mononucleotide adenylyltransferase 1-like isoform X1 n=1 Tax=Mytilus edulis TaxID=6550 RepID=UPI0039EF579B